MDNNASSARQFFADRLAELLAASGLSQKQAATRASQRLASRPGQGSRPSKPISEQRLSAWKAGENLPDHAVLSALVRVLVESARRRVRPQDVTDGLLDDSRWARWLHHAQAAPKQAAATADGNQESSRVAIWLPEQPAFTVGRDSMLAELGARLSDASAGCPRRVALCGLGGAGKTSVALEYAYRHLAGLRVAWMLAAEDPATLAAEFADLAAQLGARPVPGRGNPVAQVHSALADRAGDWLLIFDNAPGPRALTGFLPPKGRGQVIITSQNSYWPSMHVADVPVLSAAVAAQFIEARTHSAERDAARALAAELDGLPLALEQACAYMITRGRSVGGYLSIFRERRAELLARGEAAGHARPVTTTLTLAFERLRETAPPAVALLRLLARCAPDRIPVRLLLQPVPGLPSGPVAELEQLLTDPLAVDDAIAALREFSLISLQQDSTVSMHRLVQAVTLAQLPEGKAEAWRQAACVLVEAALPADPEHPANWPTFALLLPHVQATHTADDDAMERVTRFLGRSGNLAAARDLQQQIIDARKQARGAEHVSTLTARTTLAWWTAEAGDPVSARDQQAAVVVILERVCGPEHPETLTARAWLAYRVGRAGDAVAARDQYQAVLPLLDRVCGPDHIETLHARAWLAHWTGEAGDPAAARDQCAALLPDQERICGPEHSRTLTDRALLANWTGRAGDPTAARDQLRALIPVMERACGASYPETLRARMSLAGWIGAAGDPAAARDVLKALLPAIQSAWGDADDGTMTARGQLAHWTGMAGDAAAARDELRSLLPALQDAWGEADPGTTYFRSLLNHWTLQAAGPPHGE